MINLIHQFAWAQSFYFRCCGTYFRYREKALKDAEDILARSQQLMKEAGIQGIALLDEEVKLFCKESNNLRLIRGYPVDEELNSVPTEMLQELSEYWVLVVLHITLARARPQVMVLLLALVFQHKIQRISTKNSRIISCWGVCCVSRLISRHTQDYSIEM